MKTKTFLILFAVFIIIVASLSYYFLVYKNKVNINSTYSNIDVSSVKEKEINNNLVPIENSETKISDSKVQTPAKSTKPTAITTLLVAPKTTTEPKKNIIQTIMKIQSDAFANSGKIPDQYTCNGSSQIPNLNISGVPVGAKTLAIIMDDPDAPGGTYVHWVIWNIDPKTTSIVDGNIPSEAVEGYNSDTKGWYPPCPPSGT
ncbi:MAG: YbhB/YbcL family Raf kinase inhibitor-like protein, partial [bacterium]